MFTISNIGFIVYLTEIVVAVILMMAFHFLNQNLIYNLLNLNKVLDNDAIFFHNNLDPDTYFNNENLNNKDNKTLNSYFPEAKNKDKKYNEDNDDNEIEEDGNHVRNSDSVR